MPAELTTSEASSAMRASWASSGSPLAVLARIPYLSGELNRNDIADSKTSLPEITHFEYVTGEFGMCSGFATPPLIQPVQPATVDAPICPIPTPTEEDQKIATESIVSVPSRSLSHRGTLDWMEALLRLDAAIEPYSRAIVLLVVLAAAAFTLLLLRVSPEETPTPAPLLPAALAQAPAPNFKPDLVIEVPKPDTRPSVAQESGAPTAQGPPSLPTQEPTPPLASANEVLPASTESDPEECEYPSAELPAQNSGPSMSDAAGKTPVEARLRGVTPIQLYK